ncbi:MAG: ADP-ribose diphosphatase [Pasteurellales bacterium]|nr:MAG: ADP-ribose diphosphatase [Pasteurellales bacterium]
MAEILQFNADDIEIIKEETLYKGHFHLKKVFFKHSLFNGQKSEVIIREVLEKGRAAVAILYDPKRDEVVLVEQIRIGAVDKNHTPWLLELVAGMVEEGQDSLETVIRESFEEAGVEVKEAKKVLSVWDSPGGLREKIDFYVALIDSSNVGGIYGLPEEGEDILVHSVSRKQALEWVEDGTINNAIAVIGLQYLALHYQEYCD